MLFGGLILLLILQVILLISGDLCFDIVQEKSRILAKILKISHIVIRFVNMLYAVMFAIYVIFQKTGIYNFFEISVCIYFLCVLIILVNIISIAISRGRDSSGLVIIYVLSIMFIVSIILVLTICSSLYKTETTDKEYVKNIEYQSIEVVPSKYTPKKKVIYDIAIIDNNGISYELYLNNGNTVKVCKYPQKYIQKYKVKERQNNIFGFHKTEEYYEYVIYTPYESEINLISYYIAK